uniref:Secreted protein n=1 Tax=Cacopsylla melanoneura TaxID=428564 RepID=A0A8D8SAZ9_9HEMI
MKFKALFFQVTLAVTAIILTTFISSGSGEGRDDVKTTNGDMNISNLCVNGKNETCTKMTLDQATSVCGKKYGEWNYINITARKCLKYRPSICYAELGLGGGYYSHLECEQHGTIAKCTCNVYFEL